MCIRDRSFDAVRESPVYRDVSNGVVPSGIEYYMPLFLDEMVTIFDYLPDDVTVIQYKNCVAAMAEFSEQTEDRYEQRRHDIERPVLPPRELYIDADTVSREFKQRRTINISAAEVSEGRGKYNFDSRAPGKYPITVRLEQPLGMLKQFIEDFDGRILFAAESAGRREVFMELLIGNNIPSHRLQTLMNFSTPSVASVFVLHHLMKAFTCPHLILQSFVSRS